MRLGYNTNGLAHHRLLDALDLLADEGYQSVAITLDAAALDPFQPPRELARETARVRDRLDRLGLANVIETGARYVLNPRRKHDPTLLDPDPARRAIRVDFLLRSLELARELGSEALSLWSGAPNDDPPISESALLDRLVDALRPVVERAEALDVPLAFEPEPGMFVDTFERFAALDARIGSNAFQLTVDLGHVHCVEPGDPPERAARVARWGARVRNVHVEDMRRGIHEHLMFGEGDLDLPPLLRALAESGYAGGLHVELSRHSHMAVEAVRRARDFLLPILESLPPSPKA